MLPNTWKSERLNYSEFEPAEDVLAQALFDKNTRKANHCRLFSVNTSDPTNQETRICHSAIH